MNNLFNMFGGGRGFARANSFGSQRSGFGAAFVSDVTLPDGAEITVGNEVLKTWKIRNDGVITWPEGTSLVLKRCRGELHATPLPLPRLPSPGEEIEVSATIKALQAGRGSVCFRMADNTGAPFGGKLWADVIAVPIQNEPKETPKETDKEKEETEAKPQPHRHEQALAALACMGFVDRELNINILNQENGDLGRAASRLLDASNF